MPYFGASSENAVRRRFTYLASASATSISGADVNGQVLAFQDGSYVDVYLNGVKLKTGEDYDTATANTINNLSALNLNDEVEIIVYELFNVADTVSKTDGGTFNSAISVTGNITSTGNLVSTGGNLIINDGGNIGSTSDTDAISIASTGDVTLTQDLKIKDGGTIGSASDADSMTIASTGVVTFSQRDIHSGGITIADGGTIGSASDSDAITIASGGGVTFASGKRNFSEKINKKMYNVAMKSIMSELLRTNRVVAIEKIDLKDIKTKEMNKILQQYDLSSVLIITNEIDEKLFLSARNIKDVGIATVDYLDPPLMLSYKKILIVKEALKSFEKRFGT